MKQPTIKISRRKGNHPDSCEVYFNKPALELMFSARKIAFFLNGNNIVMRIPETSDVKYKISKHTQRYKKKKYNSSAKITPLIENISDDVLGKYTIERSGGNFTLTKQK